MDQGEGGKNFHCGCYGNPSDMGEQTGDWSV